MLCLIKEKKRQIIDFWFWFKMLGLLKTKLMKKEILPLVFLIFKNIYNFVGFNSYNNIIQRCQK
ncbi:MAG: hypothetical protein EA394_11340 [Bacteroidia bacterium]|nr:MAG: hypothetical protein EA394_11340 [Bacteroidia bacterium]